MFTKKLNVNLFKKSFELTRATLNIEADTEALVMYRNINNHIIYMVIGKRA